MVYRLLREHSNVHGRATLEQFKAQNNARGSICRAQTAHCRTSRTVNAPMLAILSSSKERCAGSADANIPPPVTSVPDRRRTSPPQLLMDTDNCNWIETAPPAVLGRYPLVPARLRRLVYRRSPNIYITCHYRHLTSLAHPPHHAQQPRNECVPRRCRSSRSRRRGGARRQGAAMLGTRARANSRAHEPPRARRAHASRAGCTVSH